MTDSSDIYISHIPVIYQSHISHISAIYIKVKGPLEMCRKFVRFGIHVMRAICNAFFPTVFLLKIFILMSIRLVRDANKHYYRFTSGSRQCPVEEG